MLIAERLKELRNIKNISQSTLAKEIDVDTSSISYWESGKYEPKAKYIYKIALYFKVSSDYLLGLSDNITNSPNNSQI